MQTFICFVSKFLDCLSPFFFSVLAWQFRNVKEPTAILAGLAQGVVFLIIAKMRGWGLHNSLRTFKFVLKITVDNENGTLNDLQGCHAGAHSARCFRERGHPICAYERKFFLIIQWTRREHIRSRHVCAGGRLRTGCSDSESSPMLAGRFDSLPVLRFFSNQACPEKRPQAPGLGSRHIVGTHHDPSGQKPLGVRMRALREAFRHSCIFF